MGQFQDRTGQTFGRLTVVSRAQNRGNKVLWACRCVCGSTVEVTTGNLRSGNSQSCGCLQIEATQRRNRGRPFESAYNTLIHLAAKRGLQVTLTYEDFLKFTEQPICHYCGDLIRWSPYNTQVCRLDRKDNRLGYTVENCVTCCAICNRMKQALSYEEFLRRCQKISRHIGIKG